MDSQSTPVVSAPKLPILNLNEFDLWKMRIEQYFLMIDYSLWEVIISGDSPVPTVVVKGAVQPTAILTAEQKLARRNELKARVSAATSVSTVCAQLPVSSHLNIDSLNPQRRHVPVETSTSNALVSQCDGIGSYDWSYQAKEEPANFAFMAIPSSSSASDNKVSDSEDESDPNDPQSALSFVQSFEHAKLSRHSVLPVEASILETKPNSTSSKTNDSRRKNRKTFFVCRGVDHLIKDCNFHSKPKTQPTTRNFVHRSYDKQYASSTKKYSQKHIVPAVVLTKSKPVSVTAARPVIAAVPKIMKSRPRHAYLLNKKSNPSIRRYRSHNQFSKTNNSYSKVTAAKVSVVSAVKGKKGKWVWRPKCPILDHDSRTSGNISYLSDFQELNGGYVAFGGNSKGGKITGIKREFSVPRTPQQNGIAERKNRTLIEAARTMLADSLLPIPFWAEAVNTACYV
nr:putative ribonuclease H-like domain-containing protein [Tanacetum cinerariifolium]